MGSDMNSPWQFNNTLSFVDRPLPSPPFATGDAQSPSRALAQHAGSSPLLGGPLVARSHLFVFFARLHATIGALPTWNEKKIYQRELERCAAMMTELLKADLLLAPRQAEAVFSRAMPT